MVGSMTDGGEVLVEGVGFSCGGGIVEGKAVEVHTMVLLQQMHQLHHHL